MSYKLPKIEIPNDNPFKNCKLKREENAKVLKSIVLTYQEGGVLALNGKWGTGKTTFVRMWQKYLKQKILRPYILTPGKVILLLIHLSVCLVS